MVSKDEYESVLTPTKESAIILEEESLALVVLGQKSLDEHIEQFSFLKLKGMFADFFDRPYYEEKMRNLKNPRAILNKIESERQARSERMAKILEKFFSEPDKQNLIRLTNEAIFFRSWRTERLEQSIYYACPLLENLAVKFGLKEAAELLWLFPDEVLELLKNSGRADKKLITARKIAHTYITFSNDQVLSIAGNEAVALRSVLNITNVGKENLFGQPAFRGMVRGRAVVVKERGDFKKIVGADILVIHATAPDMVHFLKNIKAIITEEGGILSHAAVISRELKIPAVIGIANATKIFKDGDMVEVDADNGVVRKK